MTFLHVKLKLLLCSSASLNSHMFLHITQKNVHVHSISPNSCTHVFANTELRPVFELNNGPASGGGKF